MKTLDASRHVAVWLDQKEARVFHFHAEEEAGAGPRHDEHQRHTRIQEGVKELPSDVKRFYHELMSELQGADQLLIAGPDSAKLEFIRYLHAHDQDLEKRVVAIETVNHPSDGQLVHYAATYFKRTDRLD
jgi:stalled ribosome rescue protein Dom34